jgi:hypothetical protein
MRLSILALLIPFAAALAQAPVVGPKPVGTMSQLMVDLIFPTSNAVFYVRDGPTNPKEWMELEFNTLVLGEAANLLMAPERARDKDQWMKDAKLLYDVGAAAYKAAKAKDLAALQALNEPLYESCQSCHVHYRPGYRRRE